MSTDFEWDIRAQNSIAQGALTNSKRASCFIKGIYPTHLKSGEGCVVYDMNNKRYIDYICALGSNLMGYGNPEIIESIVSRLKTGSVLSLGTDLEILFAERLKEIFPGIDLIKVLKTGSEACVAAVRIARTYTNRFKVLSEGYHGWMDMFVSVTPPALGIPYDTKIGKLKALHEITEEIACVIVEPIITDMSKERIQWLTDLRTQCTRTGTVLIFDEIITGFRFPKFSVSNYLSIIPDLICLGKAMGGGLPISVVGGKKDIMNCGEYFISSTFAGETCSMAAALRTIKLLGDTRYSMSNLWLQGQDFLDRFNSLEPAIIRISGYPTRGTFEGELINKALFWQEACRAGILFGPSWFFNFHHQRYTDVVISTCRDILNRINNNEVALLGELPTSPFSQKVRDQ